MPQYTPPPADLSGLNPIQRYMQKGSLDWEDYIRLAVLVFCYWVARPYISEGAKWFFGDPAIAEGEDIQKDYKAKVSANAIRGGKGQDESKSESTSVSIPEGGETTTSGSSLTKPKGAVNRKVKFQDEGDKSEEDILMDRDWEEEPARKAVEGDKSDVMKWLDKWDQ